MSASTEEPPKAAAKGVDRPAAELNGVLGVGSIVFMVVAAAAPLGVVAATFPVVISVEQSTGAPLFFTLTTVLLLLFSIGYTQMSRYVPNAGAFYSYIQAGMGRVIGTGAATLAYVSYLVLLVGSTAYFGVSASNAGRTFLHVDLPWWFWCFVGFAIAGFLGYRNVDLSARVLGVALVLETLIVIVMDVAIVAKGGHAGLSAAPLSPSNLTQGAPSLGFMFAFFCFFGFEATAVFRNEAKDPSRTVPRATYIAVVGIGVFYAATMWCVINGMGVDRAVDVSTGNPTGAVLDLARDYVAPIMRDVMLVLLLTSQFACTLSFHNVVTRYQYTMGVKRVLPPWLGVVHPKHRTPSRSSLVVSAVTIGAMALVALLGLDPVTQVFTWFSGAATLGIVAMMAMTGVAVMIFFRRHTAERGIWRTLVAPLLSSAGLFVILSLVIANFGLLVGGDGAAEWILSVLIVASFAAGLVVAVVMRRRQPSVYAALHDESETVLV
ncbi:MAG TPA: APC family permease [Amycolatopsis sp.]|nr:APC family permease [Amycolatopsis sp.]